MNQGLFAHNGVSFKDCLATFTSQWVEFFSMIQVRKQRLMDELLGKVSDAGFMAIMFVVMYSSVNPIIMSNELKNVLNQYVSKTNLHGPSDRWPEMLRKIIQLNAQHTLPKHAELFHIMDRGITDAAKYVYNLDDNDLQLTHDNPQLMTQINEMKCQSPYLYTLAKWEQIDPTNEETWNPNLDDLHMLLLAIQVHIRIHAAMDGEAFNDNLFALLFEDITLHENGEMEAGIMSFFQYPRSLIAQSDDAKNIIACYGPHLKVTLNIPVSSFNKLKMQNKFN